jgi:hypothetical protein
MDRRGVPMERRRLIFGPRFSPERDWVDEHGDPADPDEAGLEATVEKDGTICIAVGGKLGHEFLELSPLQAQQLAGFLVGVQTL